MTRKHFRLIAEEISNIEDITARTEAARAMAKVCRQCNNNFDTDKFYSACKIEQ